jgi:transposase-like protein
MIITLHKNARTTRATRASIQRGVGRDCEMVRQFGVGRDTIRRWRKSNTGQDASHTPHRPQTTLDARQEELVVYLRTAVLRPLADLLAVVHEFIEPDLCRSALKRGFKGRGLSRLPAPKVDQKATKPFKAYELGYVEIDVKHLPQMRDEKTRSHLRCIRNMKNVPKGGARCRLSAASQGSQQQAAHFLVQFVALAVTPKMLFLQCLPKNSAMYITENP